MKHENPEEALAREAFAAYRYHRNTYEGRQEGIPIPDWDGLTDVQRRRWLNVGAAVARMVLVPSSSAQVLTRGEVEWLAGSHASSEAMADAMGYDQSTPYHEHRRKHWEALLEVTGEEAKLDPSRCEVANCSRDAVLCEQCSTNLGARR